MRPMRPVRPMRLMRPVRLMRLMRLMGLMALMMLMNLISIDFDNIIIYLIDYCYCAPITVTKCDKCDKSIFISMPPKNKPKSDAPVRSSARLSKKSDANLTAAGVAPPGKRVKKKGGATEPRVQPTPAPADPVDPVGSGNSSDTGWTGSAWWPAWQVTRSHPPHCDCEQPTNWNNRQRAKKYAYRHASTQETSK